MLDRFVVRVGLVACTFALFFYFGYVIQNAGGLYFGLPFWFMLLVLCLFFGLYVWEKATGGRQAYIIFPLVAVLAVFAYRYYIGLDAAGEQAFLASLRAAVIVLLGLGLSIMLVLVLNRQKTAATTTTVTETSATVTPAPEPAPSTLD
jgi:hypothetical protein